MPEIYQFKVTRAEAEYDGESLTMKLWYPANPEIITGRIGANPEWGMEVIDNLLTKGHAVLANKQNPVKPPSAGSLVVFNDNAFVCHRRDKYAPMHKMYQSSSSGFPQDRESIFTKKGLLETAVRETAEETLFITKDIGPRLVTTPALAHHSKESAERLGFDLKTYQVKEELAESKDRLEVYDHHGDLIFSVNTFLDMMFDTDTSLNILQIRKLDIASDEVLPVDAEGMFKDGKFMHFNRKSFIIPFNTIVNQDFGHPLVNPQVYQTRLGNSEPEIYTPEPKEFLGPGATPVTHPYLFCPENLLTVSLDALGIEGYDGEKLYTERWKDETLHEQGTEAGLIPPQFLV